MEIVDRYLQAVRSWLPAEQRDDIVAELSEDLRSQVEEREAALGRPLAEPEAQALLKERGHPLWLAQGYVPPGHLIGPMVLPVFRRVVAIGLVCLAVIFTTLWIVFRFLMESPPQVGLRSGGFWLWQGCVYGFALVGLYTVVFAAIERTYARVRASDDWDPRRPHDPPLSPAAAAARERLGLRVTAAGDLLAAAIFTLFWVGVWRLPDAPEIDLAPAPVWGLLYGPILALALAEIALSVAALVRPGRSRTWTLLSLGRHAAGVALAATVLVAGSWIAVSVPGAPADRLAVFVHWLNVSLAITVAVVGAIYLWGAIEDARALVRTSDGGSVR